MELTGDKLYEYFFNQSLNYSLIAGKQGEIIRASRNWQKLFGQTEDKILRSKFFDYVHPEDIAATENAMQRLSGGQNVINFTNRYRSKDGDYRLLEWIAWPDDNLVYAIARDVTDLAGAHEEVARGRATLMATFENIDEIICARARDHGVIFFNTAFAEICQELFQIDPYPGFRSIDLLPAEAQHFWRPILNRVLSGETYHDEFSWNFGSGDIRYYEISYSPIRIGNEVIGYSEYTKEVTHWKKAQQAIEEREKLQKAILGTNIGTWEWNIQTGEVSFNDRFSEILGYPADTLELRSVEQWKSFTHPKDIEKVNQKLQAHFSGMAQYYECEVRLRHKNGYWVWLLEKGKLFSRTDSGRPLLMYGTHQDISDRKKAEAERDDLLRVSEQQNQKLTNFANIVSHNLRSHAGNIRSFLELLAEDLPALAENRYFSHLSKAADGLWDTIEHLAEAADIHSGGQSTGEGGYLGDLVQTAIANVSALADSAGVLIENAVSCNPFVPGNKAYLDSITLNLLTNAIKYRSPQRKPSIKIFCEENDKHVMLAVKDNGLGMDLSQCRNDLFGLYKTFHDNPDSKGVGLFITRSQVEALGGRIEVESEPDQGSVFKVFLPKI